MPTAFVIMPFSHPIGSYYNAIYKPALMEAGYDVVRADDMFAPRPILDDIRDSIISADLLLADLTGKNPNVFYELGLAHAIGKPVVLVTQNIDDVPFDLRHVRLVNYDLHDPSWADKLGRDIYSSAESIKNSHEIWPSPLLNIDENDLIPPGMENCISNGEVDLFFRETNSMRNVQKETKIVDSTKILQLLAKTGFSFFAPFGNRFYASIEKALERGVIVEVILLGENGHSEPSQKQKLSISLEGIKNLASKFDNKIQLKFIQKAPVCTLFVVDNACCFYEPYLPLSENRRESRLLDTFEVLIDSEASPFESFEAYFSECWAIAEPM